VDILKSGQIRDIRDNRDCLNHAAQILSNKRSYGETHETMVKAECASNRGWIMNIKESLHIYLAEGGQVIDERKR
jgi:hypothetical protein